MSEDDWEDYETGPFCRHWLHPSDCDAHCPKCGASPAEPCDRGVDHADTILLDGLPNWLDDMREALAGFHPEKPAHVMAAKLGEFAGAALAFMNCLHEHMKEQPKPLGAVDALRAEIVAAARTAHAAWLEDAAPFRKMADELDTDELETKI